MKNLMKYLLLIILLSGFCQMMYAQVIEGGGGVIALSAGANPNSIPALATQSWAAGEAVTAHDAHTGVRWHYDDTQISGSKWVQVANVSDDQTIDELNLNGTNLEISLEGDGEATQTLDLSSLQDGIGTDNQRVDLFAIAGTQLRLSLQRDDESFKFVDLAVLQDGIGTDDQTIDAFNISGKTLSVSLESDGQAAQTVDLSTRLVYYKDDGAATTGGIVAEQEYKLDTGNPYGMPKGSVRIRQ